MHSSSTLSPLVAPASARSAEARRTARVAALAASSARQPRFVPPRNDAERLGARPIHPLVWLLLLCAGWGLLIGGRMQIVRMFPPAAPLYGAIGLPVNLRQMDIAGVVSKLIEEDGRKILVIEGEIRNLAKAARATPSIKLAVLDEQGREIYGWTSAPPKSLLNSGEKAFFRARLAAPPAEGRDVRVRFAPETPDAAS